MSREYIKVCVFDLDGTIWLENSHIDIVEKYYGTSKYSSAYGKLFYVLVPNLYMKFLNIDYKRVSKEFIGSYCPTFRKEVLDLLSKEKEEGAQVIIISNAPIEIIENAQRLLNVPAYQAQIGKKDLVLKKIYSNWNYLKIITDNLSDASLIEIADEAVVYTSKSNIKRFQKMKLPEKYQFKVK